MDAAAELQRRIFPITLPALLALRGPIDAHVAAVRLAAVTRDFLDVRTAERLADTLHALLDDASTFSPTECAIVGAAINYFLDTTDTEADLTSPLGLDDDASVIAAAVVRLGRV